ncbi:hypothetical protein CRENBAI_006004 [Crenichthys baileyi]|uniref:Ig-like domain-containing protein n=1 Tax=Crenichthys baileyi TaxID=28760 RepID=A0AAV9QU01_9TELE
MNEAGLTGHSALFSELSRSGASVKVVVQVPGREMTLSLHSQAAVLDVYEGAESVLLACFYGGIIPEEDPSVKWTRNDGNPSVFLLKQGGDDPRGQNQIYRGRTSMSPDALETDVQVEVEVNKEAEFVVLPCKTSADLPKDTTVEWTRSEPEFMFVYVYPNTSKQRTEQNDLYCGRTGMNEELLRTGDLSLTLRYPSDRDSGRYICTIYRDKDILRQRVVLQQVKPLDSEYKVWGFGFRGDGPPCPQNQNFTSLKMLGGGKVCDGGKVHALEKRFYI